jgi:hypothetical protein
MHITLGLSDLLRRRVLLNKTRRQSLGRIQVKYIPGSIVPIIKNDYMMIAASAASIEFAEFIKDDRNVIGFQSLEHQST